VSLRDVAEFLGFICEPTVEGHECIAFLCTREVKSIGEIHSPQAIRSSAFANCRRILQGHVRQAGKISKRNTNRKWRSHGSTSVFLAVADYGFA